MVNSASVLVMIGVFFFAGERRPSTAQNEGFKIYQLNVFCEGTSLASAVFGSEATEGGTVGRPLMGTKVLCVGNCGGGAGPVSLDAALNGLPRKVAADIQAQVDKHQADAAAGRGPLLTCLGNDKKPPTCVSRNEKDGDMPWFDPSAPGCQDLQDTSFTASFSKGTCTLTLKACSSTIYTGSVSVDSAKACNTELYFTDLNGLTLPNKVCCDIWREGARAGCNPAMDADCDGEPNTKDTTLHIQDPFVAPYRDYFRGGTEVYDPPFDKANFDPRPSGLEWDEVMPNEPCKKCKWLAQSGKLTCSPDGKQEHEYKATWLCPTSGVQRVVTKRAPASAPCTSPSRKSGRSSFPFIRAVAETYRTDPPDTF